MILIAGGAGIVVQLVGEKVYYRLHKTAFSGSIGDVHRMNYGRVICLLIVAVLAFPALANKKAKVVTESGKKWDVLFLKMSNDTIYLKARKPNGAVFSISGHKSKFKKVEFSDGALLDLTLSDFPPHEGKTGTKASPPETPSSDSVFQYEPPASQDHKDTVFLTNKTAAETPPPAAQSKPDSVAATVAIPDSLRQQQVTEKSAKTPVVDSVVKERAVSTREQPPQAPAAAGKKKGRGPAIVIGLLSAASFAGSAGTYYLYKKYLPKEEKTFNDLNSSAVKGPGAEALIAQNKAQHEDTQKRLTMSQILLGAGAVFLTVGIAFYF
jgi:hypothetical protein